MKNYHLVFLVSALAVFLNACGSKKPQANNNGSIATNNDSTIIERPYLGQKTPGITAESFAPDTLSKKDWELKGHFALDLKEFYLIPSLDAPFRPAVIVFRRENNHWKKYDFYATDSGDSNILYCKNKYIERTGTGWSKVKSLGPMFNRKDWGIMRLTASAKGTYVFDDYKSNDVIRISRMKDGKREAPKLLGKEINTGKWTAHPFIAPDESYLIWDSERKGGYGGSDIYISFRQKDGSWGKAINLGAKVNSGIDDNSARLTADGKYLFFWRAEEKVREDGSKHWVSSRHWVDAQVIENLRPKQ